MRFNLQKKKKNTIPSTNSLFILRILKTSYPAVSVEEYIEINNIQHLYKTLLIVSKINKTRTRNNRRY